MSAPEPHFFIVGQPKCGTTALYEMLKRHPQVFLPKEKEPHFFVTDPVCPGAPRTLERYLRLFRGKERLDQYLPLFAGAALDQSIGDTSASYLWSREAATGIAARRPGAKIIAILREPAGLLRSLHLQMVETRVELEPDLLKALELDAAPIAGAGSGPAPAGPQRYYSDPVRYGDQLQRYYNLFPASQIKVLLYDDFRRDNAATVREVLRFLDLDDSIPLGTIKANPTVRVRSPRLDRLVHSISMGRGPAGNGIKRAVKAVTPRRLRRRALDTVQHRVIHGQPHTLDEQLMRQLRERYRSEVASLSDLLGRDMLSEWQVDTRRSGIDDPR